MAEKLLIKKLEEKFKSLESNIIDKKYENEIDNEEMIITTKKDNYPNTARFKTKGKAEFLLGLEYTSRESDLETFCSSHLFNSLDRFFFSLLLHELES